MDERKIIHVDMDAFFASIEQHDNPKLLEKPVIVGGLSGRGVVSTCSYEARKYGVHSAMPMYMAKSLCPNGIFLPVRFLRYREVSKEVFNILYKITDIIEPLSIDEAYLDVTEISKNPEEIAEEIKNEVKTKTGLTISAGISYNKFLAKLASDWDKPDGLKVINKDMIPDILRPLPVSKVYGIGKKSSDKLKSLGVNTVDDLLRFDEDGLKEIFGKYGIDIYKRIRGIDDRPVEVFRETKSIGKETTLKEDTNDKKILCEYLKKFSLIISDELIKEKLYGKTITVKIKTANFEIHTKSKTLSDFINTNNDIYSEALGIMEDIKLKKPVRLIGLSISNLSINRTRQLSIFDDEVLRNLKIQKVVDEINMKLGKKLIRKGSEI